MPGGKIVFYTGIIDIAKTEPGITSIVGHEVHTHLQIMEPNV